MANLRRLEGNRFGRLLVKTVSTRTGKDGSYFWLCECACGTTKEVRGTSLTSGTTKSCGCLMRERVKAANTKHGHGSSRNVYRSREYNTWRTMKERCLRVSNDNYEYYGARGVTVCERWLNSFENFLADMGRRPVRKTLDRIDPHGNYEPGNCRWATAKEQRLNQRRCQQS